LSRTLRQRQPGRRRFAETMMRFIPKILLGVAAIAIATAASFPHGLAVLYFGAAPQDIRQAEALKLCGADPSFVRFIASERDECYRQMRAIGMARSYTETWSKPDRAHMQVSPN
jgi:hypothetical protein